MQKYTPGPECRSFGLQVSSRKLFTLINAIYFKQRFFILQRYFVAQITVFTRFLAFRAHSRLIQQSTFLHSISQLTFKGNLSRVVPSREFASFGLYRDHHSTFHSFLDELRRNSAGSTATLTPKFTAGSPKVKYSATAPTHLA